MGAHNCMLHNNVECQIAKLWEEQEPEITKPLLTNDEKRCEDHFVNTTRRDFSGRFIVSVPLKDNVDKLGNSRHAALSRFYKLEQTLNRNRELKQSYVDFMNEYQSLGHMKKISEAGRARLVYYLPHHPVINQASSTTRLRVVFDASAKTSSGLSLNDVQLIGPTIQSDLFSLLIRLRQHKVVITADIAKMYRQVMLTEEHQSLHRVFWRENTADPIECYELQTVSYGTASAPYLAIRCLTQLAQEHAIEYPRESKILQSDFYVDDLLSGAESVEEALLIKNNLNTILRSAGFELRKWNSNAARLITEDRQGEFSLLGDHDNTTKTLGIWWNANLDRLQYFTKAKSGGQPNTKRIILGTVAQTFDPLGLLCPLIVRAKIILRKLWQRKFNWDDPVPGDIQLEWERYVQELSLIEKIEIARRTVCNGYIRVELHGFSEASETSFGACIFLRSQNVSGKWHCELLCAKGKVSPVKTVSLARLELNGAVLLSKLVRKVRQSIQIQIDEEYLWCDSTVVLGWLHSHANRWKTYVANRVAEIQSNTKAERWGHVPTKENPADLITRNITIQQLNNPIWWSGHRWLTDKKITWPATLPQLSYGLPEEKLVAHLAVTSVVEPLILIEKFSSFSALCRVTAYCLRFSHNSRQIRGNSRKIGVLTTIELQEARYCLIRMVQNREFSDDIAQIQENGHVKVNSRLASLAPILDSTHVLRVGGRLDRSDLAYGNKHPILLPQKHALTTVLVRSLHIKYLHCGQQALLEIVRESYWPIGARYVVKSIIRQCMKCFRCRPIPQTTSVGQLPESRVSEAPPFFNTGIDYAGPFLMKDKRTRGCKTVKGQGDPFELVSDLSTEAFLASLRRFVSRRGKPQAIHSDNATNFVGAKNELYRLVKAHSHDIAEILCEEGISWNFIPPRSPHFGGLWESGIKSVKNHLVKVIGNAQLIFEDLYTVLTQIEAVLNSRPLCPLSNDPNDLNALTPAHFLIGRTLTAVPGLDVTDIKENRLSRFQKTQVLQQHFWNRWKREYISNLPQRPRVKPSVSPVTIGTLVIVREDNLPPLMWNLGRVVEVFPGKDGDIRVASVRTKNGVYKREVRKLCVLPIE